MKQVKYLILGAGSAGLTALSEIRRETEDFLMVNGGHFGTTCARVGCMPSKALIHCAEHFHARNSLNDFGVEGGENLVLNPQKVMARVREFRDRFTQGVQAGSTDTLRSDQLIKGYARFIDEQTIEVNGEQVRAERIIIATGSRPVVPAAWESLGEKLLTSDTLFELETLPKKVAVIGLGVIGLELGQALSRLGVDVTGVEMAEKMTVVQSPVMAKKIHQVLSTEFPILLGQAAQLTSTENGIRVTVGHQVFEVDAVVAALGRHANVDRLELEHIGVSLNDHGMPPFDPETLQVADKPIFIAGDVNAYRPVLHEAGHEGRIAAQNAISYPRVTHFERKTPIGITFTDPQVGVFGATYSQLDLSRAVIAEFDLERNNGRAIVMGQDKGKIVLYADQQTKCLLGGELFMVQAEHLTHLLAWAVAQKMTVKALLDLPFYHPVLEEALSSTLELLADRLYSPSALAKMPKVK